MADSVKMSISRALPVTLGSYNCRGYNSVKRDFIHKHLANVDILFVQEHWLSDSQLPDLGNVDNNISFSGVSGFDNSELLYGRPYGGCAFLWQSALLAS